MTGVKLAAASKFPEINVQLIGGESHELGQSSGTDRWKLIVVYRGLHCPLCAKYLAQLEEMASEFHEAGADIIAVSGDGQAKAKEQVERGKLSIPLAYGLTTKQMTDMGLYISNPRSPEETDQPFPEPGLFVLTPEREIQIVDISNAPFSRPDLPAILRGLNFVRTNGYPIRGTFK